MKKHFTLNVEWTDREIYFRYKKGDPEKMVQILSELTLKKPKDIIRIIEEQGGEVLPSVKKKCGYKK